jgi:hypothetical protein
MPPYRPVSPRSRRICTHRHPRPPRLHHGCRFGAGWTARSRKSVTYHSHRLRRGCTGEADGRSKESPRLDAVACLSAHRLVRRRIRARAQAQHRSSLHCYAWYLLRLRVQWTEVLTDSCRQSSRARTSRPRPSTRRWPPRFRLMPRSEFGRCIALGQIHTRDLHRMCSMQIRISMPLLFSRQPDGVRGPCVFVQLCSGHLDHLSSVPLEHDYITLFIIRKNDEVGPTEALLGGKLYRVGFATARGRFPSIDRRVAQMARGWIERPYSQVATDSRFPSPSGGEQVPTRRREAQRVATEMRRIAVCVRLRKSAQREKKNRNSETRQVAAQRRVVAKSESSP